MTKTELKKQIEKIASEEKSTEIKVITAMQGVCAEVKDEKTLSILCDIKRDYLTI